MEGGSRAKTRMEEALGHLRNMEAKFKSSYFTQALADATGQDEGLAHLAINLDQSVPISLAGFGNFHVQGPSGKENVHVILNVWPMSTKTTITLAVPQRNYDAVKVYANAYLGKFLGLLIMIETWMINGTDHWFIRPSVWKEIPDPRQQEILDDILDDRFSIAAPFPRSIFDQFRTEAIKLAPLQNIDAAEIDRERAKLS